MRRRIRSAADFPFHRHSLPQVGVDAGLVAFAYYLAYLLRFDGKVPDLYHDLFVRTIGFVIVGSVFVFAVFGLYRHWMRYASQRDYLQIAEAAVVATLSLLAYVAIVQPRLEFNGERFISVNIPASVLVLYGLLMLVFIGGARFAVHMLYERPLRGFRARRDARSVVIVGAGDGGRLLLREILRNPELGYRPVGFVDDDPRKLGARIDRGLEVLGTTAELGRVLDDVEPQEVLIAIPSAPGTMRAKVVAACRDRGVPVRTMPTVFELLQTGGRLMRQVRDVKVEDILGREPVRMDLDRVGNYLTGRVVLVTGAGGSIGSELCRQIARLGPQRLVLVDQGETPLFEIERELVDERGFAASVPVLADCKSRTKMSQIFDRYKPAVVFHAAAYKHVPLMEANPLESVRNNSLGTRVVANAAVEHGARRFVLISTDKAVSPKTVMGQSKALCEWIVEAYGAREDISTRFVAVRFGNVLGSSGSVIPIFRRQIAKGGPVTLTHPEMTRYFMTIPEAASLVVQAGAIGGRGDVFVLDMGEPVRIIDLAMQMIRLSGKDPERDIDIDIVGARPGEKLHEELWGERETAMPTSHPKIMRVSGPIVDAEWLDEELTALERLVREGETLEVVSRLSAMMRAPQLADAREPVRWEEEDTLSGQKLT